MRIGLRLLLQRFWAVPMMCAVTAFGLGIGIAEVDRALDTSFTIPFLFAGGPEGARSLLSAIITSMISFTGLVFSITIVVLQLTSSQFSPRVLRTFLLDRVNQFALGVFVATFVYALVVLRAVRGTAELDPFVPQIAVTVAFGFVMASVGVFLGYIHHIAQSIRAASIITRIGDDTRALLERRRPADAESRPELSLPTSPATVVVARQPGVIQQVNDAKLLALARRDDVTVVLVRGLGEFVPADAALLEVHGSRDVPQDELCAAVRMGKERTQDQDIAFGLRQLVDIAERALSPGINDPTTAVQVVDQLHDILRRLATRALPPHQLRDGERLAVHVPGPTFADYLWLSVEEIAHWGKDSDRVLRRLRVMLEDLQRVARAEHQPLLAGALARYGRTDEPASPFAASDTWLR